MLTLLDSASYAKAAGLQGGGLRVAVNMRVCAAEHGAPLYLGSICREHCSWLH